jgi:hypothetical protein
MIEKPRVGIDHNSGIKSHRFYLVTNSSLVLTEE